MSIPVMPRPGSHLRKPPLGLRRKPGRLALAMFRMPLRAYRHDAGWLLGHTFLEFGPDARPASRTRPPRWCCGTTRQDPAKPLPSFVPPPGTPRRTTTLAHRTPSCVAPGTPSPNNRTKGASLPQLLLKEQAPRGLRLITTGSQRRQTPSDARRRPGTRIMRISSKGRENPPDRPDPGCCMPGRVHHGVLSAGSRRWDPGWSPVWRWRPGHGHGPGVAAPVAGDRDRDRSGRSPRRSRRRRRRLLGQGPARQVHRCRPQPALRQRDSVVPGSGDSDGDQRAQHEGRRPVPDELTSVTPHTDNA